MLKAIIKYGLLLWIASVLVTFVESLFPLNQTAVTIVFYASVIILYGGALILIFRNSVIVPGLWRGIFAALGLAVMTVILDLLILGLFAGLPFNYFLKLNYLIALIIVLALGAAAGAGIGRGTGYRPEGIS